MALLLLRVQPLPARRRCICALQPPKRVGSASTARIFWDLDNINARSPEHALVVGHRLKRAAERLTGVPPSLCAFANEHTVERLQQRGSSAESWDAVLEVLQAEVSVAGLEKDAADLLMQREMLLFAEEYGHAAAVICVSNDQGFAAALDKCGRMGALTVAVGTYMRAAGFNWSRRPSRLPVPAAANCIVAWHPGRSALNSSAELKLLDSWQKRLDSTSVSGGGDSGSAAGAAAATAAAAAAAADSALGATTTRQRHAKAHKGVCCTRWLNPNRPRQLPLAAGPAPIGRGSSTGASAANSDGSL